MGEGGEEESRKRIGECTKMETSFICCCIINDYESNSLDFPHFSQFSTEGSKTGGGESLGARLHASILTVVHDVWVCVGRERVSNRRLQT